MNQDQLLSLTRTLLKIIGTALITHGKVTDGLWEEITGAAITAIGLWWSFKFHKDEPQPPKQNQ